MKKSVSAYKLFQIAYGTAKREGLTVPTLNEVYSVAYHNAKKTMLPIIKRCSKGLLWIDKYYVAYQIGFGKVHYTYISECHIHEELRGYKAVSKAKGREMRPSKDIMDCFKEAWREMKRNKTSVWIAPDWRRMRDDSN